MSAREKIFDALRRGTRRLDDQATPPELPGELIRTIAADETPGRLLDIFIERFKAAGGEVMPHTARKDAALAVRVFIEKEGLTSVVADDEVAALMGLEPEAVSPEFMKWNDHAVTLTPASAAGNEEHFAAALGITMAQMAVAETGTLIIHYAPGRARLASLAPPLHLVLLPMARLAPDLMDAVENFGDGSGTVWITGPSKTADIGGILVRGIHGPGRIVVLPIT